MRGQCGNWTGPILNLAASLLLVRMTAKSSFGRRPTGHGASCTNSESTSPLVRTRAVLFHAPRVPVKCIHTHNLTQITPSLPPHTHCHPTVNSIQWAPHEWGLILACGSADESISFLYYTGELYPVLSKLFTLSYPGSHPIYLLFHTPYPSSIPPSPSFPPPSCLPFLPSYLPSFLPLLLPPSFPLTPLPPVFSSSPLLSLP